jgi:DNA repair protein RadC
MTPRQKLLEKIKGDPELVDRLLMVAEPPQGIVMNSPESLVNIFSSLILGYQTERFAAIALDRRLRMIDCEVLTTGNDAFCIVDPKQVFRWALTRDRVPTAVVVAHNHPSGDPCWSPQDIEVTRRLKNAGEIVGIKLLDHLIIGNPGWTSLAEAGFL